MEISAYLSFVEYNIAMLVNSDWKANFQAKARDRGQGNGCARAPGMEVSFAYKGLPSGRTAQSKAENIQYVVILIVCNAVTISVILMTDSQLDGRVLFRHKGRVELQSP